MTVRYVPTSHTHKNRKKSCICAKNVIPSSLKTLFVKKLNWMSVWATTWFNELISQIIWLLKHTHKVIRPAMPSSWWCQAARKILHSWTHVVPTDAHIVQFHKQRLLGRYLCTLFVFVKNVIDIWAHILYNAT